MGYVCGSWVEVFMVGFWQTEKAEGEKEGREEESSKVKTGDGRAVVLVQRGIARIV